MIWMRVIPWTWLPWRVYFWIDARCPHACWARLVALKLDGFDEDWNDSGVFDSDLCKKEAQDPQLGSCYCGKMRKNP